MSDNLAITCPDCGALLSVHPHSLKARIAALEAENAELRRERDEWHVRARTLAFHSGTNHAAAIRAEMNAADEIARLAAPSPDAKEA